jgi:5'-nucleotidase
MRILLTNDDGIAAEGLCAMTEALSRHAEVWVVAPIVERSAISHAITLKYPVRITSARVAVCAKEGASLVESGSMRKTGRNALRLSRDCRQFAVHGTPADCLKVALLALLPRRPDAVVSGMNHGANTGVNILYSGTVAAATEAAVNGITSVAVSLGTKEAVDFSPYAKYTAPLVLDLARLAKGRAVIFNVNVPFIPVSEIRGVRYTYQACSVNEDTLARSTDGAGGDAYTLKSSLVLKKRGIPPTLAALLDGHSGRRKAWTSGRREDAAVRKPISDIEALGAGFVSITPISVDRTDHWRLARLC